jgi:hypothetical protein
MKGLTACVCVVLFFTTIPDPTIILSTQEQAGRELQTPALSIKPAGSIEAARSNCDFVLFLHTCSYSMVVRMVTSAWSPLTGFLL